MSSRTSSRLHRWRFAPPARPRTEAHEHQEPTVDSRSIAIDEPSWIDEIPAVSIAESGQRCGQPGPSKIVPQRGVTTAAAPDIRES